MVTYKIRRNLTLKPWDEFYINVASYHLKKPRLKNTNMVDGFPIIHVYTGVAQ